MIASSMRHNTSALALLGRPDEARAALARYNQIHPRERVSTFRKLAPVPLDLTSLAYQQQRERLKEGLRKAGVPCEFHLFEKGRHGLGLGGGDPAFKAWPDLCATWLKGQGFLSKGSTSPGH